MDKVIRIFQKDSAEYRLLEKAAEMMTEKSGKGYRYYVGETYFDFGQGWKWTTVICDDAKWGAFQALYPSEQEMVLDGDVDGAVRAYFSGKYCLDTLKSE